MNESGEGRIQTKDVSYRCRLSNLDIVSDETSLGTLPRRNKNLIFGFRISLVVLEALDPGATKNLD